MKSNKNSTRRDFIKKSSAIATGALVAPTIVPSSVFGKTAPSNQINVGMVGTGRQAVHVNLKNGFLKLDNCRVIATNDVDSWRMNLATKLINDIYAKEGKPYDGVKEYDDYRDLIADKDIDAVMISTTDHWHAPATIAATLAGKHVCMEKAFSVAPMHAKAVVEAVKEKGVTGRLDSEFRSIREINRAVELVHNNVIGDLVSVEVGVPGELNGSALGPQQNMPVPKELNYDMWLGPAFPAPYTMQRVHEPGTIDSRPGWLRISDYCNGMITNWGAHLNDIALWGMKKEYEHPVTVEGTGAFDKGIWHTISAFDLNYEYADGLKLKYKIDVPFVKFIGKDGWIRIQYPNKLTASNDSILKFEPGKNDISYKDTLSDKADFLKGIETGKPTLEPLEVGYNVYLLTMMGLISITLGSKLTWDQKSGQFVGDNAANSMLTRPFREKWIDGDVVDWINKYQQFELK
ncbi:Gfo/Idh/MocA family oxidoreductase [Fulvivirgaceae bacterium BMA12]|uniref:Gfo/Idh/MocA family oxidoreductase n=2 Tax=Agaribacillus aureus TaxID=3051825 RepID=A0ABT8LI99_9BACT|nr:Gfo/Idh/MocA family oxidoreductase [Fulvivirgaceae bacterium BMA12]